MAIRLDEQIYRNLYPLQDDGKIRLNLGCGSDYKENWINCDINKQNKADLYFDMDIFPYPFDNNYSDEILLSHVLEHLDNPLEVIKEVQRILKHNGILIIKVPHFSHFTAFGDLTHKHYFSSYIFSNQDKFKISKIHFTCLRFKRNIFLKLLVFPFDLILNINPIFTDLILCKFIPVSEIRFTLRNK